MYLSLPNVQDPTAKPGVTVNAICRTDHVAVGPYDGSGRLVLTGFRDKDAAESPGVREILRLEFRPGEGMPSIDELKADPAFGIAWTVVGSILLSHVQSIHPGSEILLSPGEQAALAAYAAFIRSLGGN